MQYCLVTSFFKNHQVFLDQLEPCLIHQHFLSTTKSKYSKLLKSSTNIFIQQYLKYLHLIFSWVYHCSFFLEMMIYQQQSI